MNIDISTMHYAELSDLRARVDERILEMRENGVPELRARFSQEAAALGLSIDEVLGTAKKRKAGSRTRKAVEGA